MQKWMLAFVLLSLSVAAHDSKVAVHVVNGKSGNPVRHEHVLIFQGQSAQEVSELKHHIDLQTDANGVALLPADTLPWLRVWVDGHRLCSSPWESGIYRLAAIQETGLATANSCGSMTVKVNRKELHVFVREETFGEKMRR